MKNLFIVFCTLLCAWVSHAQTPPTSISGDTTICAANSTTYVGTPSGGAWTCSPTSAATINGTSGVLTAGTPTGTARVTISYQKTGYTTSTKVVTVGTVPDITASTTTLCIGATVRLSTTDGNDSAGIWSCDTPAIVSNAGRVVTGVAAGTTTVTYSRYGCSSTTNFTVPPALSASITADISTNPVKVCELSFINLVTTAATGGTWSSNNPGVLSMNATTGKMTGVYQHSDAEATASIQYIKDGACATTVGTVTILPRLHAPVNVCLGSTFTATIAPTASGIWRLADIADSTLLLTVDSVDSFKVYAFANIPGENVLMFQRSSSYNCANDVSKTDQNFVLATSGNIRDSADVTGGVGNYPPPGTTIKVCMNDTMTLYVAARYGTWHVTGLGGVTRGANSDFYNFVAPATAGTYPVSYSYSGLACTTSAVVQVVDPSVAITGADEICVGNTTTYSYYVPGGTWTSSNTSVATVGSSTGIVTGVSSGTAIISYKTTRRGCYATKVITVRASSGTIEGPTTLCNGASMTLVSSVGGGTWSSGNTGIATVGAGTGIVTGVSPGSTTISYTIAGCAAATWPVTVLTAPGPITGTTTVCAGQSSTLANATAGGTWSKSGSANISISTGGVVTNTGAGTAIITYMLSSGCFATALYTVSAPLTPIVCETAPISTCKSTLTFCSSGLTIVVRGAPAGSTYTWNPSISSYSTMTSTVTGGEQVNTYVFSSIPATQVYTVTTSAACSGATTVQIVKPAGTGVCEAFKPCASSGSCANQPAFETITATNLTSEIISETVPGYYFIHKSATLSASPAPGSVMVMDYNVNLIVAGGSHVVLDSCHLLGLSGQRWRGISVVSNSYPAGRLTVRNNTMIEGADKVNVGAPEYGAGVTIYGGGTYASLPATGNILTSDEAIFNNNIMNVSIRNYSNQSVLPFEIKGTIFTNRDFTCYSRPSAESCTERYPFVWPTAAYLRSYDASTGTPNNPGMKLDTFKGYTHGCNGIDMMDVGRTDFGTPNVYNSLILGDSVNAGKTNVFDTLRNGMDVHGSNFTLYNNVFRRGNASGHAIKVLGAQVGYASRNRTSLKLLKGADGTHNRFYNCYYGVHASSYYNIVAQNVLMASDNYKLGAVTNTYSYYGFYFSDTAFDRHELTADTLRNMYTGIEAVGNVYSASQPNGDFVVKDNVITGLISTSSFENLNYAMEFYGTCNTCSTANGNLMITGNQIAGAQYGIRVSRKDLYAYVDNNIIKIRHRSGMLAECGIRVDNAANIVQVTGNDIYGDSLNGVTYNTPAATGSIGVVGVVLDGVKGIYCKDATGTSGSRLQLSCNKVHEINIGFKFEGTNNLNWRNNTMTHNRFGMVLQNTYSTNIGGYLPASINEQGTTCDPIDDKWAINTDWPGWSGTATSVGYVGTGIYQTYVVGSGQNPYTYNSILHVRADSLYKPYSNGAITGATAYTATGSYPSIIAETGTCVPAYAACGETSARGAAPSVVTATEVTIRYSLSPNPTSGYINITSTNAEAQGLLRVALLNLDGRVVAEETLEQQSGTARMRLPAMATGMYIVRVADEHNNVQVFKTLIEQ